MQCKCHTYCLWSDQQPAHQRHTLILITCLLLWPLPAVTQKLPHIWRTKKKKLKRDRFDGNDGKAWGKKKRWITLQWAVLLIEPPGLLPRCAGGRAGFVSISVTGKQKRRKQRSADGRYERMSRRSPWELGNSQDDAGRGSRRLLLAQHDLKKKYSRWK